jgi:hypothetical protein
MAINEARGAIVARNKERIHSVRKLARRVAALGMSTVAAVTLFSAPAQAATNPYTAASACRNDFGGSWTSTTDGHRSIVADGETLADVYLMYNSASGKNCVATIKRIYIGTGSGVRAELTVRGDKMYSDPDEYTSPTYPMAVYKYYAAVQASARDTCVKYEGGAKYGGYGYYNGRSTWGNCD